MEDEIRLEMLTAWHQQRAQEIMMTRATHVPKTHRDEMPQWRISIKQRCFCCWAFSCTKAAKTAATAAKKRGTPSGKNSTASLFIYSVLANRSRCGHSFDSRGFSDAFLCGLGSLSHQTDDAVQGHAPRHFFFFVLPRNVFFTPSGLFS
jgi:hypothetical protein